MNTVQFQQQEPLMREIIETIQKFGAVLVLICFAGYGLALYVWYAIDGWTGFTIATISYLLFRFIRIITWLIARHWYQKKPNYQDLFPLLKANMLGLTTNEIINMIYKNLEEQENFTE